MAASKQKDTSKPGKKSPKKPAKQGEKPSIVRRMVRALWSFGWKTAVVGLLAVTLYMIYLDSKVTRQFEGNKWQLPAQVYARAMRFHPGQYLSEQEVLWELKQLNYSEVNRLKKTGQYTFNKARRELTIYRRAFEFPDVPESEARFTLYFKGTKLTQIRDERGRSLETARLEPQQIARVGNDKQQDREFVELGKFPPILTETLLVVEDRDFYQHHGVSPWSILRALYYNLRAGRTVQGGSTLTQQLAKNFYLSRERSLTRKLNEALIALILDFRYSKDEILEAYLNEVYLGQASNKGVHGMGLAAEFYFSKPVDELEFDQIALLVAMVKGPSYYNPRRYPERAMERRDLVLRLMAENQLITTREYRKALSRPLVIAELKRSINNSYPGYLDLVNRELRELLPDPETLDAGVRVFTYLDLQKQSAMENAVESSLPYLERNPKSSELEAAMVSVNLAHGGVSALVGGRDMHYAGFNRVLDSKRNIGSLVKPAIYLSALQLPNYSLATLLDDSPLEVKDEDGRRWHPDNFDHQYRGAVPLYQALSESINIPAVNLGLDIGVDKVANTLHGLGVDSTIREYPSLLLGALELSSLEVAQMYATLANDGRYQKLTAISALTDAVGKVLYQHSDDTRLRFPRDAVYMTKYAMKRVTKDGTGKRLNLHFPSIQLAGKTGTSNDLRDSWYAGFDQNTVTAVWVGRDDNRSSGLTGGKGALELYIRYLRQLNPESIADERPDSIRWAFVNPATGLQAPPGCGQVIQLPLRASEFNPRPGCVQSRL